MSSAHETQSETSSKKASKSKKAAPTPTVSEQAPQAMESALADPASASPQQVLQLQRRYGNRAVQRLIQRANEPDEAKGPIGLEGGQVSGDLQHQIDSAKGGGQPLDKGTGSQIGGALGADFSNVHVHTDSKSNEINQSLSAKAFTTGSDIFFSQGAYNPGTHGGKELIAHELTHVVQQGSAALRKEDQVQTKLTVGPAGDKYEEEADQVASQVMRQITPSLSSEGAQTALPDDLSLQRQPFIQRKSDKLKAKTFYTSQAKGGFKLIGSSGYDKIMSAIDTYQGIGGTEYRKKLTQLTKIGGLITEWEISHGHADTTTGSKDKKEGARRGVLATIKSTDLPEELEDVYKQAKTANEQFDVHFLAQLIDAGHGNIGAIATIESDYATALRTFQAEGGDSTHAQETLGTGDSGFLSGAGGSSLGSKVRSLRSLTDDPSEGQMDLDMLDTPIEDDDSEFRQQMKRARIKLRALVPALANMSDIEIMAIGAYTDEGGYTSMNQVLRGGNVVRGTSKTARKAHAKMRAQVHQANLMAASALNKLPNWDGSTVYRGEDVGWMGTPTKDRVIMLKSFTSTAANDRIPKGYAKKGSSSTSAVWEIHGITSQGKDISKLSVVQQEFGIGTGINQSQEDEVLLRPYTRLRIDNVADGEDYKYHITATAL